LTNDPVYYIIFYGELQDENKNITLNFKFFLFSRQISSEIS
jgi:hypothetical protein